MGSGRLELRKHDGSESYIDEGFLMENTGADTIHLHESLPQCSSSDRHALFWCNSEQEGNGPESMLEFIKACRGLPYKNGADQNVGLQAVRVLDAMYRSAASKKTEKAK